MQRLKELFRILFIYDPKARIDLFVAFPVIRRFFQNRKNLAIIRTFGDIAFSCLILLGIFGSQDPDSNVVLFLAWGIWWAGVVLSWFFVGKFWCGVCPFLGVGRLLQRVGLCFNLEPPRALGSHLLKLSMVLLVGIVWAETVTDMKHWPLGTSLLLLSILFGATLMGVLFKGQAWCRYVCPLGKIIGAGATMAMIEFRADPDTCRTCGKFACKKGRGNLAGCPIYLGAHNIRSSRNCLLCGHCAALCENESPRLLLRNPFVELATSRKQDLSYSFIIVFLAGSQWARYIQESSWCQEAVNRIGALQGISFFLLLGVGYLLFTGIVRIGNRFFARLQGDAGTQGSPMIPILLPLAFSGELVYRLRYLLTEVGGLPTVFGNQFGFNLDRFSFAISSHAIVIISVTVIVLGGLGSLYATRLMGERLSRQTPNPSLRVVQSLIGCVFLVYLVLNL